jgi:hypothetical protein
VLDHLETIGMEAEGQAIDWDEASQPSPAGKSWR